MRKKNLKGLLAACLSFSMVVTSFSVGGIGTKTAEAAEDDKTVFTEVLTPDQITLREKLPEKASNITEGESREVTIQCFELPDNCNPVSLFKASQKA